VTDDRLVEAIARVGLDPEPIRDARRRANEPVRVAVVGRQGVGKTSLCNAWSGQSRPVGLGGATATVVYLPLGTVTLLDTPGIESFFDPDAVLAAVDGLVWVIDGLAPLSASEREKLRSWSERLPTVAIVSRVDIVDEEEHGDVRARVRALIGVDPILADVRRRPPPLTLPEGMDALRRARWNAALDDIDARVRGLARLPSRDEVIARLGDLWRAKVKEAASSLGIGGRARLPGVAASAWYAEVALLPFQPPSISLAGLPGPGPGEPTKAYAGRLALAGSAAIADGVETWPAAEEQAIAIDEARAAIRAARGG
jgi:hypothetical protein